MMKQLFNNLKHSPRKDLYRMLLVLGGGYSVITLILIIKMVGTGDVTWLINLFLIAHSLIFNFAFIS